MYKKCNVCKETIDGSNIFNCAGYEVDGFFICENCYEDPIARKYWFQENNLEYFKRLVRKKYSKRSNRGHKETDRTDK